MTISQLLDVYDGHVVVKCIAEHSTRTVVDTRKTEGDFPFDLMGKRVYNLYIEQNFVDDEIALTIAYEGK